MDIKTLIDLGAVEEGTPYYPEFDDCVIGQELNGGVVYDADKIIEKTGIEYAEHNVFHAHIGNPNPVFVFHASSGNTIKVNRKGRTLKSVFSLERKKKLSK